MKLILAIIILCLFFLLLGVALLLYVQFLCPKFGMRLENAIRKKLRMDIIYQYSELENHPELRSLVRRRGFVFAVFIGCLAGLILEVSRTFLK